MEDPGSPAFLHSLCYVVFAVSLLFALVIFSSETFAPTLYV